MRFALAIVLAAVTGAGAHIVPVPPSTCAFQPFTVEMPATSVTATTTPAGASDTFRILYDPQASAAQFDLRAIPARTFTSTVTGTVSVSGLFGASLRNDGDLTATPTFTFATDAGDAAVSIPITTGLVTAGPVLLEGAPIDPTGGFTFVGVLDPSPLGAPLAGGALAVRLVGQAVPRPDIDQFRFATQTTPVSVNVSSTVLRARLIFAPGTMDVPQFPGVPALLRVSTGGETVAAAVLPAGLPAHGKKLFVGRSADGASALGVRQLQRSGQVAYLFAVKLKTRTLPAPATGTVPLKFTYDVGGLLSRVVVTTHVKRGGKLLKFP